VSMKLVIIETKRELYRWKLVNDEGVAVAVSAGRSFETPDEAMAAGKHAVCANPDPDADLKKECADWRKKHAELSAICENRARELKTARFENETLKCAARHVKAVAWLLAVALVLCVATVIDWSAG